MSTKHQVVVGLTSESVKKCGRCYLEVHEVHQFGDFWLQHLYGLLVDLHSVRLLVALHLRGGGGVRQ